VSIFVVTKSEWTRNFRIAATGRNNLSVGSKSFFCGSPHEQINGKIIEMHPRGRQQKPVRSDAPVFGPKKRKTFEPTSGWLSVARRMGSWKKVLLLLIHLPPPQSRSKQAKSAAGTGKLNIVSQVNRSVS